MPDYNHPFVPYHDPLGGPCVCETCESARREPMTSEQNEQNEQAGGDGGDIIFTPGRGAKEGLPIPGRDGRFVFILADGTEAIRIDPDGRFFVRGEHVTDDREVYDAFRAWVASATALLDPGATIDGTDA
jgi:hypothetical protein